MPPLFAHFRITDREAKYRYRRVQILGLLPIGFALMLMCSIPSGPTPGLWAVLGISMGLELILWGCYGLHFVEGGKSILGRKLEHNPQNWFPRLLFSTEYILLTLLLVMIWLNLVALGYPASVMLHFTFGALVLLLPLKVIAHEHVQADPSARNETIDRLLHYLNAIFSTLFIATSLTHFLLPPGEPLTGALPNRVIFIWMPSILIIIACIVLFLEHALPFWARGHKEDTDTNY